MLIYLLVALELVWCKDTYQHSTLMNVINCLFSTVKVQIHVETHGQDVVWQHYCLPLLMSHVTHQTRHVLGTCVTEGGRSY